MMTEHKKLLPYGRQSIDNSDLEAVREVLFSDFLTTGPMVGKFEEALANVCQGKYGTVVNSGTSALHLTNLALGVRAGDVVLAPAITFAATANAARLCGAEIVFMDADPDTGLVTPDTILKAVNQAKEIYGRTPVGAWITHYAGQMPRMDEIAEVANRYGFWLGEDGCHALGTRYSFDEAEGTVGDCRWSKAVCFSFHPVKTATMGEGGAVITNDAEIGARCKQLRNHGISKETNEISQHSLALEAPQGAVNPWFYDMLELGHNYRAPDILCALGLSQLKRLDDFLSQRSRLVEAYDRLLGRDNNHCMPLKRVKGTSPGWHLYVVLIAFERLGISRAECMRRLRAEGVLTQVHYIPTPFLSYYRKRYGEDQTSPMLFPGAMAFYERCLSLPLYPEMELDDVSHVVKALNAALNIGEASA